jgi:predicted RNase H-like HicB family nuclease
MKDYHINIFYSQADEGYIADIPDLRSCSAFGETPADALHELEIAKALWLEAAAEVGLKIPEPMYRPAIYAVSSHHGSHHVG